jgi:hypothetical protein
MVRFQLIGNRIGESPWCVYLLQVRVFLRCRRPLTLTRHCVKTYGNTESFCNCMLEIRSTDVPLDKWPTASHVFERPKLNGLWNRMKTTHANDVDPYVLYGIVQPLTTRCCVIDVILQSCVNFELTYNAPVRQSSSKYRLKSNSFGENDFGRLEDENSPLVMIDGQAVDTNSTSPAGGRFSYYTRTLPG